jgi:hypothetical protein
VSSGRDTRVAQPFPPGQEPPVPSLAIPRSEVMAASVAGDRVRHQPVVSHDHDRVGDGDGGLGPTAAGGQPPVRCGQLRPRGPGCGGRRLTQAGL